MLLRQIAGKTALNVVTDEMPGHPFLADMDILRGKMGGGRLASFLASAN
jgi:hypothetical protein